MTDTTNEPTERAKARYRDLRAHVFVVLSQVIPAGQVGTYADEITALVKPELEKVYAALLAAQAERDRWCDAFERLHARIHRDLNFDASESAPPDDERWARTLDDLVTFADKTLQRTEGATTP